MENVCVSFAISTSVSEMCLFKGQGKVNVCVCVCVGFVCVRERGRERECLCICVGEKKIEGVRKCDRVITQSSVLGSICVFWMATALTQSLCLYHSIIAHKRYTSRGGNCEMF